VRHGNRHFTSRCRGADSSFSTCCPFHARAKNTIFALFSTGRTPQNPCAGCPAFVRVFADNFQPSSHNDSGRLPFNLRRGASVFQPEAAGRGLKLLVTFYPRIFCRELHCFQDFTAQPSPQAKENKEFTYKIGVRGGVHAMSGVPSDRSSSLGWKAGSTPRRVFALRLFRHT